MPASDNQLFCRVDRTDRIIEVGGGWDDFALENHGLAAVADRVLGSNLLDHVRGDAARMLVFTVLDNARRLERPRTVPYRCDSPGFKRFMEPDPNGGVLFARLQPLRFTADCTSNGALKIRCSSCNRIREAGHWCEPEKMTTEAEPITIAYGVCNDCRVRVQRLFTISPRS